MTREQLRAALLAGADKLRDSRAWRFLTPEEKSLSLAGRHFWSGDNPTTNAALDSFLTLLKGINS